MPTGSLSASSRLVLDADDSCERRTFGLVEPEFRGAAAARSSYLDVLQRVDLGLRRADDVLRPRGRDGHQVQQPLAVLGPLGPLDVERRFDRRLPQVVNLQARLVLVGTRDDFLHFNSGLLMIVYRLLKPKIKS